MEKILIITGGSKGIGNGIISAYLANHYHIISISRTINKELANKGVTQIQLDLTHTDLIGMELSRIFSLLDPTKIERITLINNAGTLGQVNTIDNIQGETIEKAVRLNTITPLVSSSMFIKLSKNWPAQKSIINISSGAAQKPYFGWVVYCSTKAALDMMTQTIAIEQNDVENGVKIIAVAPGVVDTDMQSEIRQSNKSSFKDIDRFLALKADGALNDAETVGKEIYEIDHNPDIQNGAVLRVKNKT
jgi:benzil reductase ((S)-benzoin forming)